MEDDVDNSSDKLPTVDNNRQTKSRAQFSQGKEPNDCTGA